MLVLLLCMDKFGGRCRELVLDRHRRVLLQRRQTVFPTVEALPLVVNDRLVGELFLRLQLGFLEFLSIDDAFDCRMASWCHCW